MATGSRRKVMNWMFESRSKDYYEDDSGGGYAPPFKWYDFLLFPISIILFLIFFAIIEVLVIPIGIIYIDFDATAKRIAKSGKLESPGLVYVGICIAIILPILIWVRWFNVLDHPLITFCSTIFILLFTIAPLTGLASRYRKGK